MMFCRRLNRRHLLGSAHRLVQARTVRRFYDVNPRRSINSLDLSSDQEQSHCVTVTRMFETGMSQVSHLSRPGISELLTMSNSLTAT